MDCRKTEHKPEKGCEAFKDISKYFSKEEWAKLSHSEKITYVYMKRNYCTMTRLGLRAHLPDFMDSKKPATESVLSDSDEGYGQESQDDLPQKTVDMPEIKSLEEVLDECPGADHQSVLGTCDSGPAQGYLCPQGNVHAPETTSKKAPGLGGGQVSIWNQRLRERKMPLVYEEISDPEEDEAEQLEN